MKLLDRFRTAPLSILYGTFVGVAFGTVAAITVARWPELRALFVGIWLGWFLLTAFPIKEPDRLDTTREELERGWLPGVFDGLVFGTCLLLTSPITYGIISLAGPR